MKPFPLRTIVLMVLALAAFVRFYCITHPKPQKPGPVQVFPVKDLPREK